MRNPKIDQILQTLEAMQQAGEEIPIELQETVSSILEAHNRQQQAPDQMAEIPVGADLLWTLAGADPDAFASYMKNVPDPVMNAIANDPNRMDQLIDKLSQQISVPPSQADGIDSANLQSSNVFGFKYDPRNQRLFIKFQGNDGYGEGPIYEYEHVPASIFSLLKKGAAYAKTDGRNKWGFWWKNKNPSLGAAVHQLIRNNNFPYARVA